MAKPQLPEVTADMVERVAQAIFVARVDKLPAAVAGREMSDLEHATYTRMARAALRAMGYST